MAVQPATLSVEGAAALPFTIHTAYSRREAPGVSGNHNTTEGYTAMSVAIRCSEAWALFRPDEVARLSAGTSLAEWAGAGAREWQAICAAIPRGVTWPDDGARVRSNVPALILTGEADPQNPPAHVATAAVDLPNSLSLVVPGQGHAVAHRGCLPGIVSEFFINGTATGLDTSCIARMQLPPFKVQ